MGLSIAAAPPTPSSPMAVAAPAVKASTVKVPTVATPDSPPRATNGLSRETYDADNQELGQGELGRLVRVEGQAPTGDAAIDAAHDNAGIVYDFYKDLFNRNSLDDHGMVLKSTAHYGKDFNNAYWDGTHMTYGDGDGKNFSSFSKELDVVGHEMTHGVTERTAGLDYQGQSGALNESWSDVMGDAIRQWHQQGPQEFATVAGAKAADWKIGDNIFTPGTPGDALRSLKAPGTAYPGDPQPATMAGYKKMTEDNGGVHINSGIPNHAAYLVAQKIGTKDTAEIWYRTLTNYLKPNSQFIDAANDTVRSATDLFGKNSSQVSAVTGAWTAVGLKPTMKNTDGESITSGPRGNDPGIVPPWFNNASLSSAATGAQTVKSAASAKTSPVSLKPAA